MRDGVKKRKMTFTTVGASSILTIFALLCLIVFALLSLSTAKADSTLSKKSVDAVAAYYKADLQAEEILAELRQNNFYCNGNRNSNSNSNSNAKNVVRTYSCPIDDKQELQVEVEMGKDTYHIKKWKKVYTGEWKPDDTMDVWEGGIEITE